MSRRLAGVILVSIVLLAVGIRSYELTARSLWFDEAFSWRLIQFSLPEMIARDAADVHPPLYYILLQWWSVVFGSSLVALRSFSVFCAGLTVALGYLFTAYAFRARSVGLIAALLLALSGWQIQFAWEARMYTLGTAFVCLSSWLLLHALRAKPQRLSWWLLYAASAAALAYVHYYGLFTLVAQVAFILVSSLIATRGRIGELLQWRGSWYALAALTVIAVLYAPWIPTFLAQNAQVQDSFWIPRIGGWSIPDTFYRMFKPTAGIPAHTGVGWIAVALVPIVGTVIGWLLLLFAPARPTDTKDAAWLVVFGGALPFVASIALSFLGQSLYQDRFFVFAHIFIIIGLAVLLARLPRVAIRPLFISVVAGAFVVASLVYWNELAITQKPGAHAAAREVFTQRRMGEPVVVSSPFIYFAILHYAEEEFNASELPRLYSENGQLAHFAGGPILTQSDLIGPEVFHTATADRLWIVDTTGFGATPLSVPDPWQLAERTVYPEVFSHQQDVFVTHYRRGE